MTEQIEAYRALMAASATMDSTALDADLNASIDISYTQDGETVSMPINMSGNMQMILDESDLQMAYAFDMDILGESMTMSEWLQDGWVYVQTEIGDETVRTKTQVNLEEQLALLEQLEGTASMAAVNASGLAMVDSITVATQGTDTVYTMVIREASMQSMLGSVLGLMGDLGLGAEETTAMMDQLNFGDVTVVYTVDRNGNLTDVAMTFSMEMTIPAEEGGTPASMTASYDMDMTINAMGDDVRITFPRLLQLRGSDCAGFRHK